MKVQELVNLINAETDELLDTDEDHIPYVNHALDVLAYILAGTDAPDLVKGIDVKNGDDVPDDFVALAPPNGYPLGILGGAFWTMNGDDVPGVKYRAMWPHISDLSDDLPCRDMYANALLLTASYLIKKKTYIPVEYCAQDKEFTTQILNAIGGMRGGSGG